MPTFGTKHIPSLLASGLVCGRWVQLRARTFQHNGVAIAMSDANNESPKTKLFVFPSWHNRVPPVVFLVVGPLATLFAIFAVWYWFSPKMTDVGYMPEQPVQYSHELHAGQLQIDCRYCHVGVEKTAKAGVPPTATCMNCHTNIKTRSPKLELVRESYAEDIAIPWIRVHKVADYAYFDHSAHVRVGVGCESCHGRIDTMVEVYQEKPLSMGWCYECHQAGQEAYHAEKSVRELLSADIRSKRDALMKNSVDAVPYTDAASLLKQNEARAEITKLNALIKQTERSSRAVAQMKTELSNQKSLLMSMPKGAALKAATERRIASLNSDIKATEALMGENTGPMVQQLEAKSDELFKKFVTVANLRPVQKVTAMGYEINDGDYNDIKNRHQGELVPPIHCSGCHR